MNVRAHTDAAKAALEAADLTVGVGERPEAGTKWCVMYPVGQVEPTSVGEPYGGFVYTVQVVSCGVGPEQAEWVADRARTALLAPLTVTGRTWTSVAHDGGPPMSRDDEVNPPVFWLSETFRIFTSP